ncbi:pilin [Lentzea sp. NPDC006480]|uniref:pilin n=1 Tax=Lentzea sp. NPDC006480 TaxID=3157176 RepID=UPI00339E8742
MCLTNCRLALVTLGAVGTVLLLAGPAHAEVVQLAAPVQSIDAVLNNIRNWLVGISAALAAVCFTVAFLRRMAGAGDPSEIEKSKTSFRAACVGLVGVLLTPVVIEVLKGFVGA